VERWREVEGGEVEFNSQRREVYLETPRPPFQKKFSPEMVALRQLVPLQRHLKYKQISNIPYH